jgi:outer membrane protein assembly factor BamB
MEKVKHLNGKLALTIIAILVISSSLVLLNSTNTVSAQTQSEMLADDTYGWPVGPGYDSGNTFFNPGPGPNRPDILWTSSVGTSGAPPIAFDGLIFSHSGGGFFGGGSATLYAFDPLTGTVAWSTALTHGSPRGFGTATYFKVAPGYLGYETSNGIVVLSTEDGSEVAYLDHNSTLYGSHGGGSVMYWGGFWDSYDNLKLTTALSNPVGYGGDTPIHLGIAYDLSDPTDPKLAWMWPAPTGIEALGSAPGLAIFGGYGEGQIFAVNATTGELVWSQWKEGNAGYLANYWNGMIYQSASSTAITCYNATNGDVIFDHNEGGRAFFVFGDAIAYGKYIGKNIALPWGYVGAWDAYTGEPLWKSQALYMIAYLTPCVADGKFYCQKYNGAAGESVSQTSSFACWDVNTGDIIWELQGVSVTAPIIAYGNLYFISGGRLYCISDSTESDPMFHGIGAVSTPGVLERSGPPDISEPRWTYDSGADITGSAVAGNGKVYFGTLGAEVHCVDAKTGDMIWTFPLGYRMASTPALDGDRLYIGPDDGNVYCLNAETGEQIWKTSAGGKTQAFWISAWQSRSSPIVIDGRLYVGSLDGQIYCINANSGTVIWHSLAGGAARPPGGTPLVVSDAGMVFITSCNASLCAYDKDTGTPLWATQLNPNTGFDDRALVSTPVWDPADDGTLWIVSDTMLLDHLNATTGEFINAALLPYSSRSGTMTPAITTPAIQVDGSNRYLYVGDGFQIICFDITRMSLDPMITVGYLTSGSGTNRYIRAYYGPYGGVAVNATTTNNVNLNVNVTSPRASGNETNLPLRWERWLGHQVYSSPVVADVPGSLSDIIYFGDDVFSITAVNATDGNPLSVYTTRGQVFSTACLYEGWLYMGSEDGDMYAFAPTCQQDFTISAAASKTGEMWNNETLTIRGRLLPTVRIDETTGFGTYDTNGYGNATIYLDVTKPDNTDDASQATTDSNGYFEFNYNPTAVGDYGWVVYFNGEEKPWITYMQAYGEWTPITVSSPTASGGTEPPPSGGGIPMEYVYVAVAVIVIVLVAIGVYIFMRRGK